jgi:hypothetical protein
MQIQCVVVARLTSLAIKVQYCCVYDCFSYSFPHGDLIHNGDVTPQKRRYWNLKEEALDCNHALWRTRLLEDT